MEKTEFESVRVDGRESERNRVCEKQIESQRK